MSSTTFFLRSETACVGKRTPTIMGSLSPERPSITRTTLSAASYAVMFALHTQTSRFRS
jgi:hypothetical protein